MTAADRTQSLGGSEVAAALGLDPRCTPYQLWRRKLGLDPEFAGNAATRRGQFLEEVILETYRRRLEPKEFQAAVERRDDWRSAHLDGLASFDDSPVAQRVVEAKTVSAHAFRSSGWGDPWTDELPRQYLLQVLWYMALTDDAQGADVPVCVVPDDPDEVLGLSAPEVLKAGQFHVYRVIRTDEVRQMEADIIAKCREFWRKVVDRVEPDPVTAEDAALRWPGHVKGKTKVVTPEVAALLAQYAEEGKALTDAEEAKKSTREKLVIFAEDAETLVGPDGRPLATFRTVERPQYTVAAGSYRALKMVKPRNKP